MLNTNKITKADIKDLIDYNGELVADFEGLYRFYKGYNVALKNAGNNIPTLTDFYQAISSIDVTPEEIEEYICDAEKRADIYESLDELVNVVDKQVGKRIISLLVACLYDESQINRIEVMISKKLREYEDACSRLYDGIVTEKDLDSYFECVYEAYCNFVQKGFSKKVSFKSKEIRDSVHNGSFGTQKDRFDFKLSISYSQFFHLINFRQLGDNNDLFVKLFNNFSPRYKYKNIKHKSLGFFFFMKHRLKNYIKALLIDNYPEKDKYLEKLNKAGITDVDTDKLLKNIKKSFYKCINFRKVYEYKLIPEIVLDYQKPNIPNFNIVDDISEDFDVKRLSEAFTPLKNDQSIDINDLINIDDQGNVSKKGELSDEDYGIILNIIKEIGYTSDMRIAWKSKKLFVKDNTIMLTKGITQYKYYVDSKVIKSDLPANIFLLSYSKKNREFNEGKMGSIYAFLLMCSHVAEVLKKEGIKPYSNINGFIDKSDPTEMRTIPLPPGTKYTREDAGISYNVSGYVLKKLMGDLVEEDFPYEAIIDKDVLVKLNDDKIDNTLNIESILRTVNFFLDDDNMRYIKSLKEKFEIHHISDYIKDNELNGIITKVRSYYQNDLASIHFREQFNLTSDREKEVPQGLPHVSSLYKLSLDICNKLKEDSLKYTKEVCAVGFAVAEDERKNPKNYLSKLSEEEKNKIIKRISIPEGVDGCKYVEEHFKTLTAAEKKVLLAILGYEDENQEVIIESYPKTFMAKNSVQLLQDLRMNGRAYKIDAIFGDGGSPIIYHVDTIMPRALQLIARKIKAQDIVVGKDGSKRFTDSKDKGKKL